MRILRFLGFYLGIIFYLTSCTKDVAPPSLAAREARIPVEACYKVGIDLRKLTTTTVRSFVECMNGRDGAAQPLQDFLHDSVSEEELTVLLDIYNKHLVKDNRFRKVFDFFGYLDEKQMTSDLYKNFSYLTQTQVLQKLFPLLSHLYENGDREEAITYINKLIVRLIESGRLNDFILALAKAANSPELKYAAYAYSMSDKIPFASDIITDQIADLLYKAIGDRGFHEFFVLLLNPQNEKLISQNLLKNSHDIKAWGSFLSRLYKKQYQGQPQVDMIFSVARKANAPVTCFSTSTTQESSIPNVLDSGIWELNQAKTTAEFSTVMYRDLASWLYIMQPSCDLDPVISQNFSVLTDTVADGYSEQSQSLLSAFNENYRDRDFKQFITSDKWLGISGIGQNLAAEQVFPYLIETVSRWDEADYDSLALLPRYLSFSNLTPTELEGFLQTNANVSQETRTALLDLIHKNNLKLYDLLDSIELKASLNYNLKWSAELRRALAKTDFINVPESAILPFLQKIFSKDKETRVLLKDAVRALMQTWRHPQLGLGDLAGSLGEAIALTKENPFQDFMADVLRDDRFITAINPIFLKYFKDPKFYKAVEFLGSMTETGELRRLVNFFVFLAKNINVPGLDRSPSRYVFHKFRGTALSAKKDYSYAPPTWSNAYAACLEISNQSRWNDESFLNFVRCTQATDSSSHLSDILLSLKNIPGQNPNLLSQWVSSIQSDFMASPYFADSLRYLMQIQNAGYLGDLFNFYSLAMSAPYTLASHLSELLRPICMSQSLPGVLQSGGELLALPNLDNKVLAAIEKMQEIKPPYFTANNNFTAQVYNDTEMWNKARGWKSSLDYSELGSFSGSTDEKITELYRRNREQYAYRSDEYFFLQGAYTKNFNNDEEKLNYYQDEILNFVRLILRPNNIEAFIHAVRKLKQEDFPFARFLQWMVAETQVVPYWIEDHSNKSIRLVTPMDQMEILVQNSQLSVAKNFGGIGVDHVGTYFQYQIATSSNLKKSLSDMKSKIKTGADYEGFIGNKTKRNHLRNLQENFSVLERMNDLGYLRFFQVLYQEFLAITPPGDRTDQDPTINQMGAVHYPTRLAVMGKSVAAIQYVIQQGKLGDLVNILIQTITDLNDFDIKLLRTTTQNLVSGLAESNKTLLQQTIGQLFDIFNDPERFAIFKSRLFTVLSTYNKISKQKTGVLDIAAEATKYPYVYSSTSEKIFNALTDAEAPTWYSLFNNFPYESSLETKRLITDLVDPLMQANASYQTRAGLMLKPFLSIYEQDPVTWDIFFDALKDFMDSKEVSEYPWLNTLHEVFAADQATPSLSLQVSAFLLQKDRQSMLITSMCQLNDQHKLETLLAEIARLQQQGSIDSIFRHLSEHLRMTPRPR